MSNYLKCVIIYDIVLPLVREIMERYRASKEGKEDIHTRLMKNYKDIPSWWFYLLLGVTLVVSLLICIFLNHEI